MSTPAVEQSLRTIPLSAINSNPENPRKHFPEESLKELAATIREHGVLEPIVVRPDPLKPTAFELIMGERRWRSSKLAGKSDILAIVRHMSDRQALELMVIENQQREDLHPLEEAAGYQSLLDAGSDNGSPAHTIDTLAAKIGKSASYVYARIKLMQLVPAAREGFMKNAITAGHAVLIARLQPKDQLRALGACFDYQDDVDKDLDPAIAKFNDVYNEGEQLIPEKELRGWIQDNINLRLKGVPWDLADPNLVPEAGACDTCPKRSLSNPSLFAELAVKGEDTCFDGECFRGKRAAFVKLQLKAVKQNFETAKAVARVTGEQEPQQPEQLRQISESYSHMPPKPDQKVLRSGQWLDAKKGSCASVEKAIIVKGEHAGEFRNICADGSCKVHKHGFSDSSGAKGGRQFSEAAASHKARIVQRKQTHARAILGREIVKSIGAKLPDVITSMAAREIWIYSGAPEILLSFLLGFDKPKDQSYLQKRVDGTGKELNQMLAAILIAGDLDHYKSDKVQREQFIALAKEVGLKSPFKVLAAADEAIAKAPTCRGCGCTQDVACELDYNPTKDRYDHCTWIEEGAWCSHPLCKAAMAQASAKGVSKQKKGGAAGSATASR